MSILKIFKALFFCIFCTLSVAAQSLQFTSYSVENGLSQSVIFSVFQDSDGYLWVGTQDGLNRFDGYTFKKFIRNPIDLASISNNWIYCIMEDADKNIWAGTKDGLNKYDRKTGKFKCLRNNPIDPNSIFSNNIYGLAADKAGNIYVNTPPVLNIISAKTGKINRYVNNIGISTAIEDYQMPVMIDSQGIVWIASSDGLSAFNPKTKHFSNYMAGNNHLSNNFITALFEDHQGNIWIGTKSGLNKLDFQRKHFNQFFRGDKNLNFLKSNRIRSISEDQSGNIWVGTDENGGGLHKITFVGDKISNVHFYNKQASQSNCISNDFIVSLMCDRSNVLWIGTLNGLNKVDLKKQKFDIYRKSNENNSVGLSDNVIASIFKDNDHTIWIGTWGKGLNLYDKKKGTVEIITSNSTGKRRIPNDYVHVIYNDSKQRKWIGTRDGISIYTNENKAFTPIQEFFKTKNLPHFKGFRVLHIIEDRNNNFWIGTSNGLYFLNINTLTSKLYQSGGNSNSSISNNLVYSIIEDKEGLIWIGTSTGLDVYNSKTRIFAHFLHNKNSVNTLCDNFIVSLCEDFEGNIWIGTKAGVNQYIKKSKKFKYFAETDGLPSNVAYEILEDLRHNIWISTGRGLSEYQRKTNTFRNYDLADGLQDLEFNLKASFKSKDGELFFGGMNGINGFYPDSLRDNEFSPTVVITAIEKENAAGKQTLWVDDKNEISLNYDDYASTIEFAALEFSNPQKNQYSYKIEGLSEKWIEIGNRHFVPISKLPAGRYVFRVKGSNNDKVWNEKGTALTIIVSPPWWASNLAYFIYIISFISLIIVLIKLREQNLIRTKRNLEQKVKVRTAKIQQQNDEILAQTENLETANKEITIQKEQLEKTHKNITDSINYAQRIQQAVLSSQDVLQIVLPQHFIFFRPKDVVSGDFYFIKQIKNIVVIAVADCTGHGVPGAFMSMLGVALLNEIVRRQDIQKTSEVLETLRENIKSSLRQTGQEGEQQDGMDIAFCAINLETLEMSFSGAYNPCWIFRKEPNLPDFNLITMEADHMPVGVFLKEKPFTERTLQLQKSDTFYLFTDGYQSQFGGNRGDKFKNKRFKELLLEIQHLPMSEQKLRVEDKFVEWKGTEAQTDDVLVMGVRF